MSVVAIIPIVMVQVTRARLMGGIHAPLVILVAATVAAVMGAVAAIEDLRGREKHPHTHSHTRFPCTRTFPTLQQAIPGIALSQICR